MRIRRLGEEGRLRGDRAFSTKLQLSILLRWDGGFLKFVAKTESKAYSPFAYWFSEMITKNHMLVGYKCCVVYIASPRGSFCPEEHK